MVGEVPPSRMGHSAVQLEDSRIVIFGGVGEDGSASSTLRILSRDTNGAWSWMAPDTSTSEGTSPSRAWHTATRAGNGVLVIAFGLDGITGETADDVIFLKTTETSSGWQWSRTNPLASDTSAISSTLATDPAASVYTPDSRALVDANPDSSSQGDSSGPELTPTIAVNAMAAAQTSLALTRPERSDVATADSDEDAYQTEVAELSSSTRSSLKPSRTPESPASSAPASSSDAPAPTSKSSVIAGTVTAAFVVALVAGAAALYVRRRASSQGPEKTGADTDQPEPSVPPVSQLLYTRAAPKRMLSLGSAFSVNTMRNIHDLQSENDLTFERVTGREAREAVDEFGRLSPSSDTATVLGPTAHAMSHVSSADSAETQASVASYPFLTSVPRATELASEQSHEGYDLGLNMLRSRSIASTESGRTLTPQFERWPSSIDVSHSMDVHGARSNIDIAEHNAPDPFDDFHAVRNISYRSGNNPYTDAAALSI